MLNGAILQREDALSVVEGNELFIADASIAATC